MAQVALSFNKRTYRFDCAEEDASRLEEIANYVKEKLDNIMLEHGAIGDERIVLMVALTLADELFDARADIDDLLDGQIDGQINDQTSKLKKLAADNKASSDGAAAIKKAGA